MDTTGVLHARKASARVREGWPETATAAEAEDSVVDMTVDDKVKCIKYRVGNDDYITMFGENGRKGNLENKKATRTGKVGGREKQTNPWSFPNTG